MKRLSLVILVLSAGCAASEPAAPSNRAPVERAAKAPETPKQAPETPEQAPGRMIAEARTFLGYAWKERLVFFAGADALELSDDTPRQVLAALLRARRGDTLRLWFRRGRLEKISRPRRRETKTERALRGARIGDRLRIRVGERGNPVLYRLDEARADRLVLTPRVDGVWGGRVEIELRKITELEVVRDRRRRYAPS